MKKILKSAMFVVVAAAAFISCNKQEPIDVPTPEVPGAFRVKFGVESNITKAVTTDNDVDFVSSWIDGDEVAISTYQSGASIDSKVQATWINDGFYADFDGAKYDAGQSYQLKGVYPYSETGSVDFGNTRDQVYTAQNGLYDIMVSSQISSTLPTAEALVLPMSRQTATVYFHLKSTFDEVVKSVTLVTDEGKPIAAVSATLDTENGFVPTTGTDCNFITLNIKEDGSKVMRTTNMQFWFNVLPVEGTSLKLIVEAETKTFTMNKKANTTSWEAGYLYTTVLEGIPADKWVEKADAKSKSVNISVQSIAAANGWSNSTKYYSASLDDVVSVTMTPSSATSTGSYVQHNTAGHTWRVYESDNGVCTISVKSGYHLVKIRITYTSDASGAMHVGDNNISSDTDVDLTSAVDRSNFAFSVVHTSGSTKGKVWITNFYVEYVADDATGFDPLNPVYAIALKEGMANGTVVAKVGGKTKTSAQAGMTVSLEAIANEGYALREGTLKVKNSVKDEYIELDGTSFTMPEGNVVVEAEFYKLPYHVTYNANAPQELGEGQAAPTDSKDYTDDDNQVTVKEATLTCQDYNLVGWTIGQDGETVYKVGDTFEISANTTLYGKWEEKTYTVTLVAPTNGSYVITDASNKPLNDNNYASFEVTNGTVLKYTYEPATGYKFRNWQVNDGTTHTYTSQLSYTIDRKAITIEGNFDEIVNKRVYFSVNGTIQNPEGTEVEVGTIITFPADPAGVEACSFIGWSETTVDSQDTAPTLVNKTNTKMKSADVTYYAVFANAEIGNSFTQITSTTALEEGAGYLIVGNSSSTYKALPVDKAENLTIVTPSSSTISNPANELIWTLEKSGTAWKIKSVSSGKYLQISGGVLSFETNTSLNWSVSVYSSKFTWTSSASSGNKILSYYDSGSKFNAYTSANTVYMYKAAITYTGYRTTVLPRTETILSWSAPSVTAYKASTTNDFPTLTAEPASLTGIVYQSSNPSVATIDAYSGAITVKTTGTTTITASFGGDATYAPAVDASYTLTVSEYKTNVTLDSNGGNGGSSSVTATLGAAMPSMTKPSKTGHTFQGYYIDSECTGKQYYSASGTSANNWDIQEATATLYAKWTVDEYNVTLNVNGGTINSGNVTKYTYGVGATLPTNVTKTGYTFGGWYTSSTFSGSAVTTISTTDTGAKTFYAKWDAKTYTVTLNKNDHGVADGSLTATYGQSTLTNIAAITAEDGYTLKGYYTATTGGVLVVSSTNALAKSVSGYTDASGNWIKDANVTLYAQFAKAGAGGTAVLDNNEIKSLSSSAALAYTTEKTYEDGDVTWNFKCYTDQSNRPWVQMTKDAGRYIKITAPSNIKVVRVTLTSSQNSSGGIADISKHTAYSGDVRLKSEDKIGNADTSDLVSTNVITSNVATLNISSPSNTVVYLKVSSGARIWRIEVDY